MTSFRERFNHLFEESEQSQEEFGRSIGASKFQVFNWRSGRGEPDSEMLKTIAQQHGVSVAWLLGESDSRRNPYNVPADKIPAQLLTLFCRLQKLPAKDREEILSYIQFKEYLAERCSRRE